MVEKPRTKRIVAIPSSLFSELPEPARTLHVGFLARALAIYRVSEVIVFVYKNFSPKYLVKVLRYLATPQYLRRRLFHKDEQLKYVGLLPPLATPNHPRKRDNPEYREGLVIASAKDYAYVDAGLREPILVKAHGLKAGQRVNLYRKRSDAWTVVDREEIPLYWGYSVSLTKSLRDAIIYGKKTDYLVVATSRKGRDIRSLLSRLKNELEAKDGIVLLYGMWSKGLYEIAEEEGFNLEEHVDYVVNFIPEQGTRTVRTEEAVMSSLAIINILAD